ncbi:MAG: hypothetical protein ACOYYS_13645 [Chloroflexota bacterium]
MRKIRPVFSPLFSLLLVVTLCAAASSTGDWFLRPVNASSQQGTAGQISQFGVTWTFDRAYETGQFANGDYWVVGPVTIVAISPPSTESGGRTINGAMINPSPAAGAMQGYDSSMYGQYGPYFDAALNAARPNNQDLSAANPLTLLPGTSLVSTISLAEAGARPQLQSAAVLTVLAAPAPAGSFRPPYSGSDKSIHYNTGQLNGALLKSLPAVASTPSLADVERYFERPWIDHVPGWLADYHHPSENLPNYGREIAAQVGAGALMLNLDLPDKHTLLIRYVQLGIDLYGIVQNGGEENWVPNGGHASGRKWPILFAGLVLGDENMQQIGPGDGSGSVYFGEDAQTFYISQADVDRTHDPDLRGCHLEEYGPGDLGMAEWGIRHATDPESDNKAWCAVYRQCCTANAWSGFVLAARLMDAKELWAHDALFDYQDRYMATEPHGEWTRCWDGFSEEMWDTYRAQAGQPGLRLWGTPGDRAIRLGWEVNNLTLPVTTTWTIRYEGTPGNEASPITAIHQAARSYTLTGLSNHEWYTITLSTEPILLSETIRIMPSDRLLYLPLARR